MDSKFESQIIEILDNFNWTTVREVMTALDWHWVTLDEKTGKGVREIPSIRRMKECAVDLLNQLVEDSADIKEYSYIETGGFRASKSMLEDMECLKLEFIASQYSVEP